MAMRPEQSAAAGPATGSPRAFTLIEAVMSVLIVGVMLVAVLSTFGGIARARVIGVTEGAAYGLGWALLTEVVQARYEDPDAPGGWGVEAGEGSGTRQDFDDVDDYDGWVSTPPQEKDGTTLGNYPGWRRSVVIVTLEPISMTTTSAMDFGLKEVQVTVEDPQGKVTSFYALRASKGTGELAPTQDTTNVTWAGVDMQVSSDTNNKYTCSTNLVNLPNEK